MLNASHRFSILTILLALVMQIGFSVEAEEETNKNVLKAEQKYNEKMTSIIAEAHKDADKAKADYLKVLERELSNATKRGEFDEAMRLKQKLETMKKDNQVSDLFGDAPAQTQKSEEQAASKVPIEILHFWSGHTFPRDKVEEIGKRVIDEKTNTATVCPAALQKEFGLTNGVMITFRFGPHQRFVVNSSTRAHMQFQQNREHSKDQFTIMERILVNDTIKVNYNIVMKKYEQLDKQRKKEE